MAVVNRHFYSGIIPFNPFNLKSGGLKSGGEKTIVTLLKKRMFCRRDFIRD
jgi:hypothetical protein